MSIIFLKSYIHARSYDQLFDYKSDFNTCQSFMLENNTSFYKNNNFIKAKLYDNNENKPSGNNNPEHLFNIEKIINNNKEIFLFCNNKNIMYHDYRLNLRKKKREIPTHISLYNFNYGKNDLNMRERKRRNDMIKHNKNYYELNVGDVIKLGRVSLILRKIHFEQNNNLEHCDTFVENNLNKKENKDIKYNKVDKDIYKDYHFGKSKFKFKKNYEKLIMNTKGDITENEEENNSTSEKKDICRICFMSEDESNSPLLTLCKCSGDSKFIHINCLSHWFKIKSDVFDSSNNIFIKITYNTLECEICKEKFPEMACDIINEKSYEIYNPEYFITSLNEIYHNYAIFESFELINHKKIVYIISFDKQNSITIGRSQISDMKIADVTISRIHSILLRTKDNKLMIKDDDSKFGTLILLQAKNILINEKILSIQIGKILLNMHLEFYKFNIFRNILDCLICCCYCKKRTKEKEKQDKKRISCSNNNINKKQNLDDSNFNMLMINNYINTNNGNSIDYNMINQKNINIEELIDIRYIADNNVIKPEEY